MDERKECISNSHFFLINCQNGIKRCVIVSKAGFLGVVILYGGDDGGDELEEDEQVGVNPGLFSIGEGPLREGFHHLRVLAGVDVCEGSGKVRVLGSLLSCSGELYPPSCPRDSSASSLPVQASV